MHNFHNTCPGQKSNVAEDMTSMLGSTRPSLPLRGAAQEIISIDFGNLSKDALNDAENLGAALMAASRKEALRRSEQKRSLGWDRHGPTRVNGGAAFDHRYQLHNGESQRDVYISEPYGLSVDGIRELLEIQQQGWEIQIKASDSLHFPGSTLCIAFEREL